ncbi:MAG: hypothetical protein H6740_20525 [Alphaproteobacteria bacterium]|nr:hypothetical protein [Alphaproteobacteria bacterium]
MTLLLALAALSAPVHAACGDGVLDSDEGCDDGDTSSGDGCSATCQVEVGWTCQPANLESTYVEVLYDEAEFRAGFHEEPVWTLDASGLQVTQQRNAKASLYGTGLAMNAQSVELIVRASEEDDDVWGFAIGYAPGDRDAASPDWLLLDWNRSDRRSRDCSAPAGLAVSHVTGPIESLDDLWCHRGPVQELDRGNTVGLRGWPVDEDIRLRLDYSRTRLRVSLDGRQELEVRGRFPEGELALYALSQRDLSFKLVSPSVVSACAGLDSDDDFLSDPLEVRLGLDPNAVDSDGDGVADAQELGRAEAPPDTDRDGLINALDADDEGDGVPTRAESRDGDALPENDDSDRDGIPDYLDGDDDGDGVPTAEEAYGGGSPLKQDSDGDGVPDFVDVDDDGDGLPTALELRDRLGALRDSDGDGLPDYRDADDDGDGVPTRVESWDGDSDPRNDDSDRDGIPDYLDGDDDGDGVPTAEETLDSQGTRDSDGDGRPDHIDVEQGAAAPPSEAPEEANSDAEVADAQPDSLSAALDGGAELIGAVDESLGVGKAVGETRSRCGCSAPPAPGELLGLLPLALLLFSRRRTLDARATTCDSLTQFQSPRSPR